MRPGRYTVAPGRTILRDGVPYILVVRPTDAQIRPVDADLLTRKIAAMLNAADMPDNARSAAEDDATF